MKIAPGWLALALCLGSDRAFAQASDDRARETPSADAVPGNPSVTLQPQPEPGPLPPPPTPPSEELLTWSDRQPSPHRGFEPASPLPPAGSALGRARSTRAWYGWQVLTADAVSFSLLGLGAALSTPATSHGGDGILEVGLLGYAFGPALIHAAHGRFGMAPASAGVRIGLPALGFVLGAATINHCSASDDHEGICEAPSAVIGLISGMAAASALDATLFSWDKPRPLEDVASVQLVPLLSPDGKRAELRAVGRF